MKKQRKKKSKSKTKKTELTPLKLNANFSVRPSLQNAEKIHRGIERHGAGYNRNRFVEILILSGIEQLDEAKMAKGGHLSAANFAEKIKTVGASFTRAKRTKTITEHQEEK